MLIAPANNLIIQVASKFQETIGSLYVDNRLEPQDHVTITGTVVSVPRSITARHDMRGYSTAGIRPGDGIIFRYTVIFAFSKQPKNDTNVFKNRIFYQGKEYWRCNIQEAFAIIRDGAIQMLNGYVMLSMPKQSSLIWRTNVKSYDAVSATVWHIGYRRRHETSLDVAAGDTVFFHPRLAQAYNINGKDFLIIRQSHILGKGDVEVDGVVPERLILTP